MADHIDPAGHHHEHDHGGGHVHQHHHDHAHSEEYLEQLLTVGICGAFGVVAVLLGYEAVSANQGMLKLILAKPFWIWVLAGGVVLLLFSLIRGIALWKATGRHIHEHNHEHGDDCGDCGHDHPPGEAHTHGSVFWRAVVLMFPLALFFIGLPNEGFSKERIERMLGPDVAISIDDIKEVEARGKLSASFADISLAMNDAALREIYSGQLATVKGQLKPISDREFTLFTLKMTCCAGDTVPLKARIFVVPDRQGGSLTSKGFKEGAWLEVTGVLQFVPLTKPGHFLPVIRAKMSDINSTDAE